MLRGSQRQWSVTVLSRPAASSSPSAAQGYADVPPGLDALASNGWRLVAFSNSPLAVLSAQLQGAGLYDKYDAVVSVEGPRVYKPARVTYEHALSEVGVSAADSIMVACHGARIPPPFNPTPAVRGVPYRYRPGLGFRAQGEACVSGEGSERLPLRLLVSPHRLGPRGRRGGRDAHCLHPTAQLRDGLGLRAAQLRGRRLPAAGGGARHRQ